MAIVVMMTMMTTMTMPVMMTMMAVTHCVSCTRWGVAGWSTDNRIRAKVHQSWSDNDDGRYNDDDDHSFSAFV